MKALRYIALVLLCTLCRPAYGQWQLSEQAIISILTCDPHDEAVFTLFGHAAFRVQEPARGLDVIFNYGIFDFSKPNFMYRFALGETDYKLDTSEYSHYIASYQMRGSNVTEQVLDLNADERQHLWEALVMNAQPENAVYRYNFFFDNCATRLPVMVEKSVEGKIVYNDPPKQLSFRDMVSYCTRNHPWITFGCDIALGSPSDRLATPHEMMFLPVYLKDELAKATVQRVDGTERRLVAATSVVDAVQVEDNGADLLNTVFTPLLCGWLLFALIAGITYLEWQRKKAFVIVNILLFSLAGIAGCVLFFLCFISTHPCMWPNWSTVWLHPFHLIAVILICLRWKKAVFCYHFINFAALFMLLCAWHYIPQQLNTAFIPLIAILCLRSWHGICNYLKKIG